MRLFDVPRLNKRQTRQIIVNHIFMRVNYKCQIYTFAANAFILICLPFIIIINYIYHIYMLRYIIVVYTFSIPVCVFCNYICIVVWYTLRYTVNVIRLCIYSGLLKPKLLTINILHAFTSSFALGKWCATSIYIHTIRTYWTRIYAVFAIIFRKRYNYIMPAVKMSCRACKCPFWVNVEILENGDGGRTGGVPGFSTYTQAAKNLEFF